MLHPVYITFLFFCFGFHWTEDLSGAGGAVVVLKEEVKVQSKTVRLEDVADVRGQDGGPVNELARTDLGPAPDFGAVTVLSRHRIRELIESTAGPLREVVFEGAAAVQIRLKGRGVAADEIASILKEQLAKTTGWKETEIEIRSISNLKGIDLPPGEVKLSLSSDPAFTGRNRILAAVEVSQEGKTLRCFWTTAEVVVRAPVLTASRAIPRDKVIGADDIVTVLSDIPDLRASYARSHEALIGKVSRKSFAAGDPLTLDAFANPLLVRNGETVKLTLKRNGIVLTSAARAEQDGKLGQVIKVRNLEFSTRLKAQVTGRAEVRLE